MKLIPVVGARPNFMKIAPLLGQIQKYNNMQRNANEHIDYVLVHTGQHYDLQMSDNFFLDLNIPRPDFNMEVGSGSHSVQTANIMIRFEQICLKEKPDWVIVVGDVNSTIACTLVAAKMAIKVAHIEAGLRSFDRSMPEEINRLVTDALADLLLTPSKDADQNLLKEGVPKDKIKFVGNIMIDTMINNLEKTRTIAPYKSYGLNKKEYVFVTLHRPSNVDDRDSLRSIMQNLTELSEKIPIVFPVHPRTRKNLDQWGLVPEAGSNRNLILCKPVGYFESIGFVEMAKFVLTDSGGLQEETTFLKVPCLTLRPNTERPVTITTGTNQLTSIKKLQTDINQILEGNNKNGNIPELWDGLTSERILKELIVYSKENGIHA